MGKKRNKQKERQRAQEVKIDCQEKIPTLEERIQADLEQYPDVPEWLIRKVQKAKD